MLQERIIILFSFPILNSIQELNDKNYSPKKETIFSIKRAVPFQSFI